MVKATKDDGIGDIRALSSLIDRLHLSQIAGLQFGGDRDLYSVFGYKTQLRNDDFLAKYLRQDIVARIIDAPVKAIWGSPPEIVVDGDQSVFDKQWKVLVRKHRIWTTLSRVDKLAQLGRFSVLLIGVDDTGNLDKPVRGSYLSNKILYLQPFGEASVAIEKFEDNPLEERFGLPLKYKVSFDDPRLKSSALGSGTTTSRLVQQDVHYSRIVHVVTDPLEDLVFSTPIIAKIYNLLDDLMKIVGGTAETYWLTSNRGMQADIDKDMVVGPDDAKALTDEIDEYQHQLRRFIRTRGVNIKTLGGDVPKPKEAFNMIISLISGSTGIPQRILLGSEAGQLASEQDRANWSDRIDERRSDFAEPFLLRPLIDNFMMNGILPEMEYDLEWPDSFKISPLESSERMAQQGRAAFNLSKTSVSNFPILTQREAREIIGLPGEPDEGDELFEAIDPKDVDATETADSQEEVAGSDTDDTMDSQTNPT